MAEFTPSKKTAQDFNNGVEYVDGDETTIGDAVQAETVNNLVESALYTQEQAEEAIETANNALEKIEEVAESSFLENGNYPNLTAGKATNDGNGDNIPETYVKISNFDRLILETEYPVGGKPYIQYEGMQTPAQRWANTSWEIDTNYQGRTIIGSGGDFAFGATGGATEHNHSSGNLFAQLSLNTLSQIDINTYGGGKSWQATHRLNLTSGSYTTASHSDGLPVSGSTDNASNMPPYIVVNIWKRTA